VIGYGNDLRGDDAVGPRVAQAVAAWDLPGVCGLAVHQLTPELAEILAAAALAIFVDARVPAPSATTSVASPPCLALAAVAPEREDVEQIKVHLLEPSGVDTAIGHTGDPSVLLAFAAALYGRYPSAWSITIPAQSFAFGADLSPAAERGLTAALRQIRELIDNATDATYQPQRMQRAL
jgi:Ni,Fe-hydrogenase maturation factor